MELIFFGVGIGMILSAVLVGIGVEIGVRNNKGHSERELDGNIGVNTVPDNGDRDRGSHNRCHTSVEEIAVVLNIVLHTFWHNLSEHEKDCMEAAIDHYENLDDGFCPYCPEQE